MTHFITILSQDRYINLHTHKNIIVEQYQQYNIPLLGFRMSHTNLSVSYDCIYIGDKYRRKTKVTRVIHEPNIENRWTLQYEHKGNAACSFPIKGVVF